MEANPIYTETQRFRQWWLWAIFLAMLCFQLWLMVSENAPAWMLLFPLTLILWFATGSLATRVDGEALRVRLMWFFHTTVPLSTIAEAKAIQFRPLRDCGGWGLKRGKLGWYWTTEGDRGVLLRLTDGKQMVVGSQTPDELAAALVRAMRKAK